MPFNSETKYMAVRCRPSYGEVHVYYQFYIHVTGKNASKTSPCVMINWKFMIVNMPTIMKVCSNTVMFAGKT